MVLLQLTIRVDNRGQLLHHPTELAAGQGEVQLVIGHVGVDPVADAAETGRAALGLQDSRDRRTGGTSHQRRLGTDAGGLRGLSQQQDLLRRGFKTLGGLGEGLPTLSPLVAIV